ncbi:MAG: flavodoxin family protein [Oscillospiraceae bacterium]|jgi:multimeric flavodoxin WrbA|nr:flavodoxin family protein [Oscillospiraceae bacterium]
MPRKTLIINGSPRVNGDTAALLRELRRHLDGETAELSAFRANLAPCVDCRGCLAQRGCVVRDDMQIIYDDDFDAAVLATPVYYSNLPGPVLGLMSRFQPQFGAKHYLNDPILPRPKKGGLILVGGGKGNESGALRPARILFRMLNAEGFEDRTVLSMHTDTLPAERDAAALEGIRKLAAWLNG